MDKQEIDKQIAEKIMGWMDVNPGSFTGDTAKSCLHWWDRELESPTKYLKIGWKPSVNITHAFEVVNKMVGDQESDFYEWNFKLGNNHIGGNWWACFEIHHFKKSKRFYGYGDTPAIAICLAALNAITQ